MNKLKLAYYRAYQFVFDKAARCLHWRKPKVMAGAGMLSEVFSIFKDEKIHKVMIVTGRTIGETIAPIAKKALEAAGIAYEHYSSVSANPTVKIVDEIQKLYLETGCQGFLAIGGGSPMDAAKAAAARVVRPKKSVNQLGGLLKVLKKLPPFVAVPTTSGTGSETTIAAVITDQETHHKYAINDLRLIPKYAILDCELTRGLPQKTTSTTGMDALTHAVEAYVSWTYNTKESIRLAEEATVLIFKYLERAYNDGNDLEARQNMMNAAYKAGFAFTRAGVGNVHAIAHTLGGLYNTPHGLANAVILPIVLEDYGKAVYPKLAHLAELTGVMTYGSDEQKAKAFICEIRHMNQRMNIPKGFDFIKQEDIPQMVEWALKEANPFYPVPVIYDEERCTKVINRIINEA